MANYVTVLAMAVILLLTGESTAVLAEQDTEHIVTSDSEPVEMLPAQETQELAPPAYAGKKAIWIYLGSQEAIATENGEVVRTYKISSGGWQTPTPRGEFKIFEKQDLRISSQAVPYRMPYYMAFTENEAFGLHALPYLGDAAEDSDYWHEAREHIGIPVSHGCVRFLPEEAIELYHWADVGMPVYIQS